MKRETLHNHMIILFSIIAILSACSKEDNGIESITLASVSAINDISTPISQAAMGDIIAVKGTGLSIENIDSIFFNDVKFDMNEAYCENNIIYLPIPVKLPVHQTDKIYFYNSIGTQSIDLVVISPELKLDRMFNEYTAPGDTLMIYGNFFALYELTPENGIVDFAGKTVPVIQSSNTYLKVKVPEDVDKNIKIKVKSVKYNIEKACPGRYFDRGDLMIMDFDGINPDDMTNVAVNPADKNRLDGNYLHIDQNSSWTGWWYVASKGDSVHYTDDMLDNYQNYVIKCEFKTGNQIVAGTKFCNYLFWDAAPMEWQQSDFVFQSTGRWETITLPFVVNRSATYGENMWYDDFNIRLEIAMATPRDFSFDNIRVCRIDH